MNRFLFGKTLAELSEVAAGLKFPSYTAKQLAEWLYKKHCSAIEQMTNLSVNARALLAEQFEIGLTPPAEMQESVDGTRKYLFAVHGGHYIESVYIPDNERATLCVSSQAGCRMACRFCMTARQGLQGNLTADEIVNQLRSIPEFEQLTNVVFMGMGEPFDNIDEVLKALDIITAPWGYAWSPKRVTVSSIGVLPATKRFLDESKCHLAISLHNPFDEERQALMPMQKMYPIADVMNLLRQYDFTHQRRVSFEYILFDGINDSPRHAARLAEITRGIACRVNLIRFHPMPDSPLASPSDAVIAQFQQQLMSKGLVTTVRASRGMDILAACGMLSTKKKEG